MVILQVIGDVSFDLRFQRIACLHFFTLLGFGGIFWGKTRPKLTHTHTLHFLIVFRLVHSFAFRLIFSKPIARKSICRLVDTCHKKIGCCQNGYWLHLTVLQWIFVKPFSILLRKFASKCHWAQHFTRTAPFQLAQKQPLTSNNRAQQEKIEKNKTKNWSEIKNNTKKHRLVTIVEEYHLLCVSAKTYYHGLKCNGLLLLLFQMLSL